MDTTATITIEFSLEKEPPKLGAADAGGMMVAEPVVVKRDSAAAPDTITVTALNFAEGDTITWNIEETGTFDITVVDEEGMMMEEAMFPTTGTTIQVYAKGMGDAGSVSIYAYSGMDTTNTITIEFSLEKQLKPKLESADAGGMMIADPVAVSRDADAPPDTVTVTALNFAEGDTITWNVMKAGAFDITVVDQEGMMMEEAMFPTTGTTIQVYAKGMGDAGSVSMRCSRPRGLRSRSTPKAPGMREASVFTPTPEWIPRIRLRSSSVLRTRSSWPLSAGSWPKTGWC
jgi:plastocyanin